MKKATVHPSNQVHLRINGGTLPGEETASRAFLERHKDLFSQGERLLGLAFSFKPIIDMRRDEAKFFQALIGLSSKSIKTFRGIHLLCSRGLCDDALGLTRTLLEILTSIKHLQKGNRADKARKFWEHAILKLDELNRLFEDSPRRESNTPKADDESQRIIRAIKSQLSPDDLEKRLRRSWHGKQIVSLAKKYDLPSAIKPYKFASSSIHASDILHHFDIGAEGELIMKCVPDDSRLRLVLETSNVFFMAILWEVNAVCSFGLEPELTREARNRRKELK